MSVTAPPRTPPGRTAPGPTARHAGPAPSEPVEAELASALRMVVARLGRRLRVERPADVLPAGVVAVLATLARGGAQRITALAAAENVRPPSMTRTVAALVEQGLVERAGNPDDGRQVLVSLTDAGRGVLEADRCRRQAWFDDHLRALAPAERASLRAALPVLQKISEA